MARGFGSSRNNTLKVIAERRVNDEPMMIDIDKLKEHPDNEFLFGMQGIEHMKRGIEKNGWKGAIEVWELKDGTFLIYSGHRRVRAAKELGWTKIRCFVYPYPEREETRRRELLGANLFGRNSINAEDPIHTARQIAYHRKTIEMERENGIYDGNSDTRAELASWFGTSDSQIYRYESLLNLEESLQDAVENKQLQFAQASSMASMSKDKQLKCFDAINELKRQRGTDNITRNDVQKIINHIKKFDEEEVDTTENTEIIEKVFTPAQTEKKEEVSEQIPGQNSITDWDNGKYMPEPEVKEESVHGEQESNEEITENTETEEKDNQNEIETDELIKPDENTRIYFEAFARKFIEDEYDWLKEDYTKRALDVLTCPIEIKNHLDEEQRTWYIFIERNETKLCASFSLFDEYVQLWDENHACVGNYDWFYIAQAIQSMWNVIALEEARKNAKKESREEINEELVTDETGREDETAEKKEQEEMWRKFKTAFDRMEDVLTERFVFEDEYKEMVIDKLSRLQGLIKTEKEVLDGE